MLFVDDSPDERELFEVRMGMFGADVVAVETVPEALGVLERGSTDVLVTDIALPELSGYDLVRYMHGLPPEKGGSVPAVAVTGYAEGSEREMIDAAGFDALLVKPYGTEALVATLEGLSGRVEQLRAVRDRCATQQQQRALRDRLEARRNTLQAANLRLAATRLEGEPREAARRALAVLGARRFGEAHLGGRVDDVELVSSWAGDDGTETWRVCVIRGSQLLIADVTIDAKGAVSAHAFRHA